jgi:DNA polymerase I-like protein with 3'-5' exonuclease and polymerase domains
MLGVYNNDGDIHLTTAAVAKQTTVDRFLTLAKDEIKEARRQAKAINFGLIYGLWWKSLITYAKVSYGVDFTENEARRIHADFFNLYPSLSPWHEKMKSTAMNTGQVRSYTGRIRHLPMVWSEDQGVQAEALRQCINSSVQETASSLGVMAMTRLEQNVDPKYLAISGFVHDAIYASVEPRHLLWGARTLKWYMETNPIKKWFDIDLKVKIVADAGFGKNGGEVHEMEGLTLEGDYDFSQHDTDFCIPEQETPPNNGRYTPEPHLINYTFRD